MVDVDIHTTVENGGSIIQHIFMMVDGNSYKQCLVKLARGIGVSTTKDPHTVGEAFHMNPLIPMLMDISGTAHGLNPLIYQPTLWPLLLCVIQTGKSSYWNQLITMK